MTHRLKKIPPAAQARVDALAAEHERLTQRRKIVEDRVRAELGRQLLDHEAVMAMNVFRALAEPGITNRAIMVAIHKQNPDIWKKYLEKWSHLRGIVENEMRDEK